VGFPIHEDEPSEDKGPFWLKVWQLLSEITELKVIHLSRRNLLKRKVSEEIAKTINQWTLYPFDRAKNNPPLLEPMVPAHLEKHFEFVKDRYDYFEQLFSTHDRLEVSYEDLCSDLPSVTKNVQHFLDVPVQSLNPATQQRPPYSLGQIIPNFPELKSYFNNTPWAPLFSD
jgi:hypothetical protein